MSYDVGPQYTLQATSVQPRTGVIRAFVSLFVSLAVFGTDTCSRPAHGVLDPSSTTARKAQ